MTRKTNMKERIAKITLKGREFTLVFDMNAFCSLEELYGSVEDAFKELTEKRSIKNVRAFLWAGLQNGPDESLYPTLRQVGSMVAMDEIPAIVESLKECLESNVPDKEDAEKNK